MRRPPIPRLGWLERSFLVLLVLDALAWLATIFTGRGIPGASLLQLAVYIAGLALLVKAVRIAARKLLWRVRNRMIVVFVFIGLVPLLLVTALAGLAIYLVAGQVAVYMATSELDRRSSRLRDAAAGLAWSLAALDPSRRAEFAGRYLGGAAQTFPELQAWIGDSSQTILFPSAAHLDAPKADARGVVRRGDGFYLVARAPASSPVAADAGTNGESVVAPAARRRERPAAGQPAAVDVVLLQPLNGVTLAALAPGLGSIEIWPWRSIQVSPQSPGDPDLKPERPVRPVVPEGRERVPAPAQRFDYEVVWPTSPFEVARWSDRDQPTLVALLVRTRPSAVYRLLFGPRVEFASWVTTFFLVIGTLFLIVELVSVATGISITRTVTNSVHELYEGTRRVNRGDFSQRIAVAGHDQLSELSRSFNSMTDSIERLIEDSKERQRLASEIEIAREVQEQLFPKAPPSMRCLEILGVCHAARMVSGDYFDFVKLSDDNLVLAVGDVAGKGISGALLMASIQSMLRSQMAVVGYFGSIFREHPSVLAAISKLAGRPEPEDGAWRFPTERVVSQLNRQLHENTPAEKYATFFLGAYDDRSGLLTYTNAGHLLPVLIRDGQASRLDVNGMPIGLFSFAQYEQSELELRPGDLLVLFTDGVTEPENEFVEEFGESRLIDLLLRNRDRTPREIIDTVIHAVGQWTGRPELQDDMTMVVARRLQAPIS